MKLTLTFIFFLSVTTIVQAQNNGVIPKRSLQFRTIGKDSINLSLNEDYNLIEDSCATIFRHAHIILQEHKFVGKFKDISRLDTNLVLTEGKYTASGLKTGLFVAHYLNGQLQSQGVYDNNKYYGHWEAFYNNGKPQITFEAQGDTIRVTGFWDSKGNQLVKNGKGTYMVTVKPFTWEGKLVDGLPDGTWHAYKTGDRNKNSLVEESFKHGVFRDGKGPMGKYTNASHINTLVSAEETFPYTRAEQFIIGPACGASGLKGGRFVNAQFSGGTYDYSTYIFRAVGVALTVHRALITESYPLKITGNVSEKGDLVDLKSEGPFDQSLAQEIMGQIRRNVPLLEPATLNGVPVKQPIVITVTFKGSLYTIGYRFLPVKS